MEQDRPSRPRAARARGRRHDPTLRAHPSSAAPFRTGETTMSTIKLLTSSLVALALAVPAVGCSSQSAAPEGNAPASAPAAAEQQDVGRELGLNKEQQAKFAQFKGGKIGRGKLTPKKIERRVARMTKALDLTPEQQEKLRA